MAYIPKGAEWYVSELVEKIEVEGEPRVLIHRNLVLISASSPEQAYSKSLELGKEREDEYPNEKGQRVRISFLGLHALNVVYDELAHGTELIYWEDVNPSDEDIRGMIRQKEDLAVFSPITPPEGPDFGSAEVMRDARALIRHKE